MEPAAGSDVEVTAYVLSEAPIAALELWAGAELVDRVEFAVPTTRASDVLTWTGATAGVHPLLVRSTDLDGRVGQAFPVWVRVVDPPDVASSLVGRQDAALPPRSAPAYCPSTIDVPPASATGIAVYAAGLGSGGFVLVDVLPPKGGTVTLPSVSGPALVYTEPFTATGGSPSPPVVTEPCPDGSWAGDLDVDEQGRLVAEVERVYLYVTTDGAEWARAPAAHQSFVEPGADGRFDVSGLLPAVQAGGTLTVEGWGWKAGALVALGRATFTADLGGSPSGPSGAAPVWKVAPGQPLMVTEGSLDWVIPTVDTSDLQKPVKGEALLRSALLCTFKPELVLPVECANSPTGALPSTTFRWQPAPGSFTHGVWQVSVVPPPEAPVLAFPGLIGTGPVAKPGAGSAATIDFQIPGLAEMLASTAPSNIGSATKGPGFEQLSFEMVAALGKAVAPGATPTADASLTVTLPPSWTGKVGGVVLPTTPAQPGLYVRVVPIDGAQPQPQASNLVGFDLDHTAPPPPPPPAPPGFTLTATLQPPRLPNTTYSHCLRVVENPFGSKNPVPANQNGSAIAGFYPLFETKAFRWVNGVKVHDGLVPGATVCALEPVPPDDDWWDVLADAVAAVAWVWDLYADVYGLLKEKIVAALVLASGCEAWMSKAACATVGGLVVNFAAMYVGMPPTLPKFGELMESAKGDLKAWLIEAAVQSGVVDCGASLQSACEQLADEMLDQLLDEIQTQASKAATAQAKSGGYTLFLNPAIVVVPEPAGIMSPAVFTATLTRTDAPSTATACTVVGAVWGATVWSWDADDGYHTKQPVSAVLMKDSVSVDVAGMTVGQSKVITLVLDELFDVFLPGQPPSKGSYINPEYDPSQWIFFLPPSVLTTGVGSACAAGGSPPSDGGVVATWPQTTVPVEPWEIP